MKTTKYKLEDLIEKGKYSWANDNINSENFPLTNKIDTENWKIINPNKTVSSAEALEMIKKEGCRPANIYELALWKINHESEIKKRTWLVALGQTWTDADGYHRVPYVNCRSDGGFGFRLGYFESVWLDSAAFFCFSDSTLKLSSSESLSNLEPTNDVRKRSYDRIINDAFHCESCAKIIKNFFLSEIKRAVKEREDEIVKAIKEELETQVIGQPDFMKGYDKALEYIITLIEDKK